MRKNSSYGQTCARPAVLSSNTTAQVQTKGPQVLWAICHVVVAEKDEGESKRGGGLGVWGGPYYFKPVLVTKVEKPQMIEEANAVRDSESGPDEEDGLSHPEVREVGKRTLIIFRYGKRPRLHRSVKEVGRTSKALTNKRARQREQSTWSGRTVRL